MIGWRENRYETAEYAQTNRNIFCSARSEIDRRGGYK